MIGNGITKINYYTYANQAGIVASEQIAQKSNLFFEDDASLATKGIKDSYIQAMKIFNR